MNAAQFQEHARKEGAPPPGCGAALEALWLDGRGEWEAAHAKAQEDGGRDGAWVHAYLHRKEGDESNARYWYARAGRQPEKGDLGGEWLAISEALLRKRP
jgi:hypothetical protein